MIEPGKIVKSGGHCYGPCGEPDCAYWTHNEAKQAPDRKCEYSACLLFGNTDKDASRALFCCDKIYGKDYEGRP